MAHPKHEQVRERYGHRCGYCDVSEVDAGGELTVDHYCPRSAGGGDDDDNLVYACSRCNLFKGDFWPGVQYQERGHRVLHPLRDDVSAHLAPNEQTGQMEALTETGRFHITLLQLNRPPLVALRVRRRLGALLETKQSFLEAEIAQLRLTLDARERYIALLRRQLGLSSDPEQ
jgi:HNH endonuclease